MTGQLEYQTEGMRRTAAQVDAQVEPRIAKAEARVMDAARHQGEEKWGTSDLGEPIVFGCKFADRLTNLEEEIHKLSTAVEQFAQKVKLAASRADATEEEITQIFTSQASALENHEQINTQGSLQAGGISATSAWES